MPLLPHYLGHNTKVDIKPQGYVGDSFEFILIMKYFNTNQYLYFVLIVILLQLVLIVDLRKIVDSVQELLTRMAVNLYRVPDLISNYVLTHQLNCLVDISMLFW